LGDSQIISPLDDVQLSSQTLFRAGGKYGKTVSTVDTSCLVCDMGRVDVQYRETLHGTIDNYFVCEVDAADEPEKRSNQMYLLENLPQGFLEQHKNRLESGNARICLPDGKANKTSTKVEFSSSKSPTYIGERQHFKPSMRRQLMNSPSGTHTVLAVVVSSTAGESDKVATPTAVAGNLFGVGTMAQTNSVASQYKACSNGKLNMVAATGRSVVNGVLALTISSTIAGSNTLTLQNNLITTTNAALGISSIQLAATHVLFCLPDGKLRAKSTSKLRPLFKSCSKEAIVPSKAA
jgi:hypothetical protein